MKLTANVTWLFLSAVNKIYLFFLSHRCGLWNKLNQWIFVMLVIGLLVLLKWMSKRLSWEMIVFWNVYVVNGLQSESKRPIAWEIECLVMKEGWIPAAMSPLWETLRPMISKVDDIKFFNPSLLDIWTYCLLVILCGMPKGL